VREIDEGVRETEEEDVFYAFGFDATPGFLAPFLICWSMDGWMVPTSHTLLTLLTDDYNAINGLFPRI
jgi:hypothetical protein